MSNLKLGFGKYMKEVRHEVDQTSKVVMLQLKKRVKELTPVITGYLRSRWDLEKIGWMHYAIKNDARYAAFVENGTPKMRPRGMLKRALKENKAFAAGMKAAGAAGAAAAASRKK